MPETLYLATAVTGGTGLAGSGTSGSSEGRPWGNDALKQQEHACCQGRSPSGFPDRSVQVAQNS